MKMMKMDKFCDNLAKLLQNPENYIRPDESLYKSWVDQTALLYNNLKSEENFYGLPASGEALPELYTDGLDMEQIWQQVELQNNTLLAAPDDLTSLDNMNLPYCVVKLNSRLQYDSINNNIKDKGQQKGIEDGSESEMEDEEKDGDDDDDEDDDNSPENEKMEDESGDDMDEDEEDDLDMDLDGKEKKPVDSLLNGDEFDDEFGDLDSSDFDEDHYDDLAPEGQEDTDDDDDDDDNNDDDIEDQDHHKDKKQNNYEDDDDDDEEGDEINNMKKSLEKDKNKMDILKKPDKFKSTTVDDSFFNLRESEWVADNDILGTELEGNLDDIDFFEDVTDEEEDAGAAMYNTFFDSIDNKKKKTKKNNNENINTNSEEKENEDKDESPEKNKEESEESEEDEDDDEDEGVPKMLGGNKKEKKSTFEVEQEKERQIIESLEEEQMTEKPWFLKGEVQSRDRPENSTLEEHLDYDIAVKQRPVITEDTTALVEKLILNRIRTQAFDDVQRKVKPEANPFEYKKKLLLDQEKSKKSLAEIYEEEYIKKQKEEAEDEEEPKAHTEIKSMMDSLFMKLDALANYHFMPKHRKAEVKIVSNLPAVTMEEASPATATDASLLAPQEVLAPVQGELRSAGERTTTDKKRERRQKKAKQKARAKEEERKLAEKLKKVGGSDGKKLDANSSAKAVQKAVKAGQVKMLSDNQSNKHIKSSQSFFKQLQDDVSSQIKKKKDQSIEKKKKKEVGQITASKILL